MKYIRNKKNSRIKIENDAYIPTINEEICLHCPLDEEEVEMLSPSGINEDAEDIPMGRADIVDSGDGSYIVIEDLGTIPPYDLTKKVRDDAKLFGWKFKNIEGLEISSEEMNGRTYHGQKQCPYCKHFFTQKNKNQKFCCPAHRKNFSRREKRKELKIKNNFHPFTGKYGEIYYLLKTTKGYIESYIPANFSHNTSQIEDYIKTHVDQKYQNDVELQVFPLVQKS